MITVKDYIIHTFIDLQNGKSPLAMSNIITVCPGQAGEVKTADDFNLISHEVTE